MTSGCVSHSPVDPTMSVNRSVVVLPLAFVTRAQFSHNAALSPSPDTKAPLCLDPDLRVGGDLWRYPNLAHSALDPPKLSRRRCPGLQKLINLDRQSSVAHHRVADAPNDGPSSCCSARILGRDIARAVVGGVECWRRPECHRNCSTHPPHPLCRVWAPYRRPCCRDSAHPPRVRNIGQRTAPGAHPLCQGLRPRSSICHGALGRSPEYARPAARARP
jgi:hypothetical protein